MKLKIMTINLRFDKPDKDESAWAVRRSAVAAQIRHYDPDIIGTQEGLAHQLLDLHRLLPEYQSVGGDREAKGTQERCAIFFRSPKFHCVATGDFWLSETPDRPGSMTPHWENPVPRMATWGVFAAGESEQKVAVCNTHLDYHSDRARKLGAQLIRDRLATLEVENIDNLQQTALFFITGDFNAEPGSPPRETLGGKLGDRADAPQLRDALADVELDRQQSFHDFTGNAFAAVDTIYYDARLTLQQATVDAEKWEGVWPSDHYPAIAQFK